ncbi:TonB-dependent receptor [Xanthomonas hortorum]|uniref:TonB-dependent receptor n=1 Tax=Xanthomonas hortorum TaxID=56454 RepID=UPI001F3D9EF5|nr:TonB-dependent receptor [Xanthomonas hortorum]MCE4510744.1 TonB-dependent receptor [Xanthomonas hortorum pv. vitians]MCE4520166.1 TonB-dependent receptor [Xanthomonas hortorum pv. vitians]
MHPRLASSFRRSTLTLALTSLLTPALAMAEDAPAPADPQTPPSSDTRHDATHSSGRHIKDLDKVVVTASPLRDAAGELSRPVEVLAGERLDEVRSESLGETVSSLPGVQSSNFGPGVGRPIIRGLDGPRVAVLRDGLSTQDVSTVSQDHSPAIEPFLANQIEVLKGPSTLLYGSGAIGGVVNVVDGRIAETPVDGFSGRAEVRFDGGDKDGNTDMFRVDAGNGSGLSIHADGVYRNQNDYDTPQGRQANSWIDSKVGSIGASLSGDWGFVGLSASRFRDNYGNPGEPGDLSIGERGVSLKLQQDRYDLKGGLTDPWGEGSALRYSFGHTDYAHTEFEGEEVGTVFTKRANEGRVEASFTFSGGWQTAFGLQGSDTTFQAVGEESFVPKTDTRSLGVFGVARNSWDRVTAELGARVDKVKYQTDIGVDRDFTPTSFSLSGGFRFNEQWRLTANLDHAERAPAEEELFANGPHIATLAFEIGDANLKTEKANQAELGLNFQNEWVDAKVAAYYNRYNDFVYIVDTGNQWFNAEDNDFLPIRQWTQADAIFHGFEGEATFHLANNDTGAWDLRVFGDTVRARLNDGGNLPRIAPGRAGAQMRWNADQWRASLGATRTMKQDKIAVNETATDGYTFVDAHLAYHVDRGSNAWEVFLDGNNLTNQDARVHTSFLKDDVMLPGRSASFGVRMFF